MEDSQLDLLIQFTGLLVLVSALVLGYRRWIKPRTAVPPQGQGLLLLIILTLLAGVIGGFGWWFNDPRSFAWALPPLAGRMLASAGWAFGLGCWLTLEKPTYHRVRLILLMLATYLFPLLVAIVLFHLNRFDFSAPITYGFFALVLLMVLPCGWYLFRQPRIEVEQEGIDSRVKDVLIQGWFAVVTVITGLWGFAFLWTDRGPLDVIWLWPGDLLTSRLIGVMLLTIAVGSLYGSRNAEVSPMMLRVIIVYGTGVVIANLWNALSGKPIAVSYILGFGLLCFVSALLVLRERRQATVPGPVVN